MGQLHPVAPLLLVSQEPSQSYLTVLGSTPASWAHAAIRWSHVHWVTIKMGWNLGYHAAPPGSCPTYHPDSPKSPPYLKLILPALWKGTVSLDPELQEILATNRASECLLGCLREFPKKCQVLKSSFSLMFVTHSSQMSQSLLMKHFVDVILVVWLCI